MAFKNTLDGKSAKEKERHISIQIAQQFNSIVANIKTDFPDAASHLPQAVTWKGIAAEDMQIADITFLDFELLLNQVLAVFAVIQGR